MYDTLNFSQSNPSPSAYDELSTNIINLYASIQAAYYQLLKLIQEFDDAELAGEAGFFSTAQWLGYYLGLGSNAAREKVRVARALPDLPKIEAAYAEGELSFSKVRALTRVAHRNNESCLLQMAKAATAHQVERIVRDQVRTQKGRAPVSSRPELNWQEADNGDVILRGRLPKELGLLLINAIEYMLEQGKDPEPETTEALPLTTRRANVLIDLAEAAHASSSNVETPRSSADRYTIHVDHDDPALSQAAIDRLSCDGSMVVHQHDAAGNTINVGRKTRTIPPAIRRALRRRDKGCRFPNCSHTRFVDAHHIHHWAHGGETRLDNLILLCRHHHTMVHERRARVTVERPEDGAVRFRFYADDGIELLPTGDGCVASAIILPIKPAVIADVTAVTSKEQSPFAPIEPNMRPDYGEIAWVLGELE